MISILYDGGGTTNALQVAADLDAVIALATQPTLIATGNHTGIELFLSGAVDDKTPLVVCINHSSDPISLTNIIHIQEDSVSAADMAFAVDRSIWGLAATVDHEPKRLVYFPCAPDSYVSIVLQSADTTVWYLRYRLTQMHTAARGGAGAAEGDAATEAKQDDNITQLSAAAADLNELTLSPVEAAPTLIELVIGTPDTATVFASDGTDARSMIIQAKRAAGNNVANVYVGTSTIDRDTSQQFELTPGASMDWPPGGAVPGFKFDLNDWYMDGTDTDDGLTIMYVPAT